MMNAMKRSMLLAATLLTPAAAFAQTAAPATADAAQDDGGLAEIVVTARKTSETLSTAPIAVSVVTAEKIQQLGMNSIDDFAKQATGISFSQAFGRSSDRPVIRGQSNVLANVQFGVETGAAYFVDGIYYQGDIQGFDPESLERVEIIKGPQSALYGRNTYAGAINFITKGATEDLSVNARLSAAEYGEFQAAGSVSGQIIPGTLGFRVGGRYFEYGGQYVNQLTGRKVGQEKTASGYVLLDWGGNGSDLKVRQRFQYQADRDGALPLFLQGAAANNCFTGFRSARYRTRSSALPFAANPLGPSTNDNQYFCGPIQAQPNGVRLNIDPMALTIPAGSFIPPSFNTAAISGTFDGTAFDGIRNNQWLVSQVLDWNIGGSGWTFTSLTQYRDNINLFGTDSDHSDAFAYFNTNPAIGGSIPNPLTTEPIFANTNRDDTWDVSQEVRLSSPQDAPVRGLVGAYYFKQKQDTRDLTFAKPVGGEALGTTGSAQNWLENRALFGAVTVEPFKGFEISGELRYMEERKRQLDLSAPPLFCAGFAGQTTAFGAHTTANCRPELFEKSTDPRITINYTTPGGTLFYGIFATGRKPGGFNGGAGVTATTQTGQDFIRYLPEKATSFEFGAKFSAFDNRLRVGIAGYVNDLTNVQLTTAIPNPNGTGAITSIVTNQGDGRTKGFEIDMVAAPTRGLTVNLNISYTDARFTKGCDADLFILNSGGIRPNFDTRNPPASALPLCSIAGKRFPLGSQWILNGGVNYELPVGNDQAALFNVNWSFEDKKFIQTDNFAYAPEAFLLNARIGYRFGRVQITAFGRNLLNEDAITLATRWFDLRYGAGTTGLPAASSVTFNGSPAQIETGTPRGFFANLRKGRTFGLEARLNF